MKKRRIELKKMRVQEGFRRHGHGHTYGNDDKCDSDHVVKKQGGCKHKRKTNNLCSACGSSTHKRPTHRDCPFNSAAIADSDGEELSVAAVPSSESESDFFDASEFEPPFGGLCTCGSSGRTHKRECPLSLRKRFPRWEHETFPGPVPPSRSPSPKHVPIKEKKPSPTKDISPQMKVGGQ